MFELIETLPASEASASVIWLHGLGASGDDFVDLLEHMAMPGDVRFVLPHAPARPVTINGGMVMPAWFDILGLDRHAELDKDGIRQAGAQLAELIDAEVSAGIPSERIVVMGFSQGGALALYGGLRYPERLAGLIGLSTYLPLAEDLTTEVVAHHDMLIGMAHGDHDDIVFPESGEMAREVLTSLEFDVDWQLYSMGHEICWEEVRQIRLWLHQMLPD